MEVRMRHHSLRRGIVLLAFAAFTAGAIGVPAALYAHSGDHFSAGEPGDPTKPFRTVNISIHDGKGGMGYTPQSLEVHLGEQIKFVISNEGLLNHEFILASTKDNLKHAALMKKYPDMEHDDPNGKTIGPYNFVEILWRFSRKGEFEFSCLIPGHREAGMIGKVIVK
jgi:uncharacterized cupredoxin-like copper-binding protein